MLYLFQWCMQYIYDAGYAETQSLAEKIYNNLQLSESQSSRLKTLAKLDALSAN